MKLGTAIKNLIGRPSGVEVSERGSVAVMGQMIRTHVAVCTKDQKKGGIENGKDKIDFFAVQLTNNSKSNTVIAIILDKYILTTA